MPQEAILKQFKVTNRFLGYQDKIDVTQEDPGVAVSGSQNIIMIDGRKIGNRPGFSYVGGRSTDRYGIQGGGSWKTSTGTEIMWRSFFDSTHGVIEIYYNGAWEVLIDTLTGGKVRAATWWSSTEVEDLLIMVCGDDNLYAWSGAVSSYASATVNTLTKQGTTTWAEDRFLSSGTRKVRIKDNAGVWQELTYTGGEGTTTLTGVTPDPTGLALTAGALAIQSIATTTDKPAANVSNDFVGVYLNYLFVFDEERRTVLMSKNTNYTDFTAPTSPRLPGEAAVFTLDEEPTAVIAQPDGDSMYISTQNRWYQFTFTASSDLTKEAIAIKPLKNSPLEGATNSLATANMKNYTVFTTGEPTLDTLGNIENVATAQSVPLSDSIKNYLDDSGVDKAAVSYYKNNLYNSLKESSSDGANNRILIRNLANGYWETPWTIPSTLTFEYGGSLYAHNPSTKNTYKLLDGYSDGANGTTAGAPIAAKWYSSHDNFGMPFNQKEFNVMWIDGYIRANTELGVILSYDFGSSYQKFTLKGTNGDVVLTTLGGGLGFYSLGSRSLGGRGETLSASGLKRFRGYITLPNRAFYEMQTSFQSNGVDYRWEVCSFGFNVSAKVSTNNNLKI
jgi:hypothetical protein